MPDDLPPTIPGHSRGPSGRTTRRVPTRAAAATPPSEGRYRFGDELGRGGMGVVQAAVDRDLQRELAVKWLQKVDDPVARRRFINEARITGQLEHPNIVPVHELGEDGSGRPFLAMKRVAGSTFGEVIAEAHRDMARHPATRAATRRRLVEMWRRICDAVAYAHSRGILHRDLKPPNVMIGEFGEVLVMDWGLARVIGAPDDEEARESGEAVRSSGSGRREGSGHEPGTLQGVIIGTPAYMPPEQATGSVDQLDEGADIYALGAILYTALTNERPVAGRNATEQLRDVIEHRVRRPMLRAPKVGVPRELDAIVMKAMARRRRDRYATVPELSADVDAWLAGQMVGAATYSLTQRLGKWMSQHRSLVLGATATFVALLLGAVAVLISEQGRLRSEAEAEAATRRTLEAEQAQREAELRELVRLGEIDALVQRLGGKLGRERDAALRQFDADYAAARAAGKSDDNFLDELPTDRVEQTIRALETLVAAHAEFGAAVPVTADDWFYLGLLCQHVGNMNRSRECLDAALQLDGTHVRARNVRANQLVDAGEFDAALADFDAVLATNPDSVITFVNRGNLHYRRGDYRAALRDWERAAEIEPNLVEIHTNRGTAERMQGDLEASLRSFERALRIDSRSLSGLVGRSVTLRTLGRLDEALRTAQRAVDLHPQHAESWGERACALLDLKRYDEAIEDFDRAIELAPRDDTALYNRGIARMDKGDAAGAMQDFRASLAIDPEKQRTWNNLVAALQNRGRLQEALLVSDDAVRQFPQSAGMLRLRGSVFHELGNLEDALRDLDQAVRLSPNDAGVLASRAVVRSTAGDNNGAMDDVARALELEPDNVEALSTRASVKSDRGDQAGALADYNAALAADPDSVKALVNRGKLRREMGDLAGSLADYNRAIELDPGQPIAWLNRGVLQRDRGQIEAGLADVDRAVQLDSRLAPAWRTRGNLLRHLDRFREAIASYDRSLAIEPGHAGALNARALCYEKLGETDRALAEFAAAIEADPTVDHPYANRGQLLARLGRTREALADIEQALRLKSRWQVWVIHAQLTAHLGDREVAGRSFARARSEAPAAAHAQIDAWRRKALGE